MRQKIYKPNIAIHPGETLSETIEVLEMTQADLADRTDLSKKTINEIVQKKNPITPETAIKFGLVFGTSPDFWNNLQRNYEETVIRLETEQKVKQQIPLLDKFECYNELAALGHVERTRNLEEKVICLLQFFRISSLELLPTVQATAFRQTKKKNLSRESLAAWLRCGEIEADKQQAKIFDKDKLYQSINELKALTKEAPEIFSKRLIEICLSFGVVVALVPHFKKTYVNGATKWVSPNKALIQLSLRGSYDDIFWFSFFHELGHLVKHGKKRQFVEFDYEREDIIKKAEREADEFARNILIPKGEYSKFVTQKDFSIETVKVFAEEIGVAPSIVAGRLSHDTENWKKWVKLRKRLIFKK